MNKHYWEETLSDSPARRWKCIRCNARSYFYTPKGDDLVRYDGIAVRDQTVIITYDVRYSCDEYAIYRVINA